MLNRGDQIGQFVLLNHVGSGGFGDVWKAEKRTALDTNYFALKFFRPKDDRIDFDKIGKELAVWKQLKGLPHIISVIELDRFDDYVYVVSDFADGGSLENWLKDNGGKASSQAEAVKITLEILRGLENLHEKGFVHRDLKPDNILIMNGRHCLADFGVSREIKTHSKATGTAGTMEYMPPEAFEKNPSITQQTDIWAVGVILQKLLTGALPYPQEDYPSLVSAILMYEPEEMPKSVPEGLREIVKKALQKKREDRFQTAREMIEALKKSEKLLVEFEPKTSEKFTIVDEDFDTSNSGNLKKNENDSKSANDFNNIAKNYATKGDYDSAIKNYNEAIALKPDYEDAYLNRGLAYYYKGNYEQAIKDYSEAIALKPDYEKAYYNRGFVYYYKGNYDQAIADFRKALEINPNFTIAKDELENTLKKRNK